LIEKYRFETSRKVINNPKVVSFRWLKSQKLDDVRRLLKLKEQLLKRFLEMKGNIYPYLIRVFYTNLKFEGNNLVSHVKGVDMKITHEVWDAVTGLKYVGSRINKGNNGSLSKMGFTKISGRWASKDGEHGGSSTGFHAEHGEKDQEVAEGAYIDVQDEEQPATDLGAGTSVGHQGNRTLSMSSFESYMVNRLDGFAENQRNLHDLCVTNFQNFDNRFQSMDTCFQTLDEQIEAIQNQLFELQYGKED